MAFPEHLTADILSRLPAKSLVRFSSVRKEWQALIRDPHFISQHLNLNIAKEDQSGRLLVRRIAHGFGYHPLIDDYKVVRIVSLSCFGNAWIRAEVYSQRVDCWQELPDLSFLEIPTCTKLADLKQSLYLIVYTFSGRQREIYAWKMIEHDAEVFWKREWTIGPLFGIERPLGCGLYGEIYMESRKGELVLYNPSSEEAKHIPIRPSLFLRSPFLCGEPSFN
ncbi:F-box/kelch-repeat protein [Prunus yedoensis var. nudiflora]|uniref:F-box/kelch-repeat protein n=1 Tax=Prunus yedoensis var. nudiflora TaxID=2094558 RepID=A0A314UMU6_PRUYE|nr:F-box/kelch-repeat protein [Prunus yedoensis var. nudiflora]